MQQITTHCEYCNKKLDKIEQVYYLGLCRDHANAQEGILIPQEMPSYENLVKHCRYIGLEIPTVTEYEAINGYTYLLHRYKYLTHEELDAEAKRVAEEIAGKQPEDPTTIKKAEWFRSMFYCEECGWNSKTRQFEYCGLHSKEGLESRGLKLEQ